MDSVVYQCNSETVTIPVTEYEKLLGHERRVTSLREILDEFYMNRSLLRAKIIDDKTHQTTIAKLRRVFINRVSVILSKGWDG